MAKPREQTYALATYLKKIQERDISNDCNVQRNFVWGNDQVSELVITVLTDDYIPPIILCEEENSQIRIADGGQRTAALNIFRNCNKKISSSVEDPIIHYKKKVVNGDNITWEDAEFNVKNKTYSQLPDELKKTFDDYQIKTVIHEHCDMHRIANYIKRYNNHVSMNTNQKAFTYLDNFADIVRRIIKMRFFIDCSDFSDKEKDKGVLERVLVETVMCINHLQDWKKQTKAICAYLNKNAKIKEFEKLEENIRRLENVITDDTKVVFNAKDSFIFLTLFDRFTNMGFKDCRFNDFLSSFQNELRGHAYNENGKLFDEIDKGLGTKDKTVVMAKLDMLTNLMYEFLGVGENGEEDTVDILDFVRENVYRSANADDVELYEYCLSDYTVEVKNDSVLLELKNHPSLVAITAYAFIMEKDSYMNDWMRTFFDKNDCYIEDQKKNYLYMKDDFDLYCRKAA